jgi:hypothetical protein
MKRNPGAGVVFEYDGRSAWELVLEALAVAGGRPAELASTDDVKLAYLPGKSRGILRGDGALAAVQISTGCESQRT